MARKTNTTINGTNYFRVTATVGKDSDGIPIRKQFYGESKKEAEAKRDEYMENINKGLAVNYDKALFGVAFKTWFTEVLKPSISLSTYTRYEIDYRRRIASCGISHMRLTDIRAANIQALYNTLLESNTPKTIRAIHKLLMQFFIYCVKADIVIKNPLLAVELPKVDYKSTVNKAISDDDINKLLKAVEENISNLVYVFAIFSGLREGEILALTKKDIDMDNETIHVNKSVKYLTVDKVYKPVISSTKTINGVRTVPMLGAITQYIQTYMQHEEEKHNRMGIPFTKDSILFSSCVCTYRDSRSLLRMFNKLCTKLGIERVTVHSLRHTFCTILAKQGVPLKTASILMGHSDIGITARIYTHVDDAEKRRGIEKLSTYFGQKN
ncbi:MAG: site-specific integrase [Defluviitaleaceae bacterium]|nr:site-specific integrase [Defluviitaleaceae bacterium]MCL2240561.1 site-specific integrase [Defluviitaleaceae bacterium]